MVCNNNMATVSCLRHQHGGRDIMWKRSILKRFSYDLEMKTREQNRNNKRTEIVWLIGFFGFWLVKRMLGWKNFQPENFLEINGYFALTLYCNTIGQSNNAFSILGFSLVGKRRVHVLIFSSIGLWNRWLVCECVVTQIYGICSPWVIGSRQNQCKIQNTQVLNWKSWKIDAVVGLFSDLA